MLTNIFSNSKTKTFTIPANQQVNGNVESSIAVIVMGRVDGDIATRSDLLIKAGGSVHGKISATNVMVEGRAYGAIRCADKLTAMPGAHIEGEISASEINIEPGAVFIEKKEEAPQTDIAPSQAEPLRQGAKPALVKLPINPDEKFTGVIEFRPPKAAITDRWF